MSRWRSAQLQRSAATPLRPMHSNPSPYKRGQWIVLGTVLGAFIGLLFGKFAIGLIFGFFVGLFVDSKKRKAAESATKDRPTNEEDTAGP